MVTISASDPKYFAYESTDAQFKNKLLKLQNSALQHRGFLQTSMQ
jgi:hypothetical protein